MNKARLDPPVVPDLRGDVVSADPKVDPLEWLLASKAKRVDLDCLDSPDPLVNPVNLAIALSLFNAVKT